MPRLPRRLFQTDEFRPDQWSLPVTRQVDAQRPRQEGEINMSSTSNDKARAVAETAERYAIASVAVPATPERVFRAISSREVINWWVRPGVFDTTEWAGEVSVGGRWRASGTFRDRPYTLEGEFLTVAPNRELVHTWQTVGPPAAATIVAYRLEPLDRGTRIMLRHSGFASPEVCSGHAIGWETSFDRLSEIMTAEAQAARK